MKNFVTKLTFSLWYWFKKPPWDTNVSPPELIRFIEQNQPGRALDLGCGTGTNVIQLAQNGWEAVGVDFAPRAVKLARKKAKKSGLDTKFHVGDVTKIDFIGGSFDLILDIGCFHSIPEDRRSDYLGHINRLLAPEGTFLLYVFFRSNDNDPKRGITEAQIAAFSPPLQLTHRENGMNRGERPSAWLWFKKKPQTSLPANP